MLEIDCTFYFYLLGLIYKIKDSVAVYLEKFCKYMKLREAIEKDLTNPDVMVQIRVLGIMLHFCLSFFEAK